jgi:hypothetical protein
MNSFPVSDPQELICQFNEDEAVWCCFEDKRMLRRLLGPRSLIPEEMLDDLDWLEAEREVKQVRAVGKFFSAPNER